MRKWIFLLLTCSLFISTDTIASENSALFNQLFSTWTQAFNHKNLAGSCNLFSRNVIADYQGIPTKNYTSICDGFKKIFKENRDYRYSYKIKNIYRAHDLAAVRITWYLQISEKNKVITKVQDEGLDIFQLDKQKNWKIINYLGFPTKDQS